MEKGRFFSLFRATTHEEKLATEHTDTSYKECSSKRSECCPTKPSRWTARIWQSLNLLEVETNKRWTLMITDKCLQCSQNTNVNGCRNFPPFNSLLNKIFAQKFSKFFHQRKFSEFFQKFYLHDFSSWPQHRYIVTCCFTFDIWTPSRKLSNKIVHENYSLITLKNRDRS